MIRRALQKEKGIYDQLLHVIKVYTPPKDADELVSDNTTSD